MVYQSLFVRRPLPPVPDGVTLPDHGRLAEIQDQRKSPVPLSTAVDSIAARNLFSPTRTEATTAAAAPSPPLTAAEPTLPLVVLLRDPSKRRVGAAGPAGGPGGSGPPFPAAARLPESGIEPPAAPPGTPARPWTVLPNPGSRQ